MNFVEHQQIRRRQLPATQRLHGCDLHRQLRHARESRLDDAAAESLLLEVAGQLDDQLATVSQEQDPRPG